jgi:hypothetical protein
MHSLLVQPLVWLQQLLALQAQLPSKFASLEFAAPTLVELLMAAELAAPALSRVVALGYA